jgi:hypothetical protein
MRKPEERKPLGTPRRRWEDNIKMHLRKVWWGGAWTGSIWLRIGTGGGLLWIQWWTFGLHKMRGISWVAEGVLASQEGLCSMEWVIILKMYVKYIENLSAKSGVPKLSTADFWWAWVIPTGYKIIARAQIIDINSQHILLFRALLLSSAILSFS